MALHWQWENKIGELTISEELENGSETSFNLSIYKGNAMAIFVYEYKNEIGTDLYTVNAFFEDKSSMNEFLGMKKGSSNFGEQELIHRWQKLNKLTLFKDKCIELAVSYSEIVSAFSKAFDDFTIEIK